MESVDTAKALEIAKRFLPRLENSSVAIESPGTGEGFWVGASSAVEYDGIVYLAYRNRQPIAQGRGVGVVIAKSSDGINFETIQIITKEEMDAESLERPTLVRTAEGAWHLYLSCATTGTKHWRVELLVSDDPANFKSAERKVVLPGDEQWGVKDTVIAIREGVWHLWATMHPLDVKDQEDRMWSRYASSGDGITWQWQEGMALSPRTESWDQRGARITAVYFADDMIVAFYDGRASAEENYDERTGIAVGATPDAFTIIGGTGEPFAESPEGKALRYLDIVPSAGGKYRLYYEVAKADGSHELRTELV